MDRHGTHAQPQQGRWADMAIAGVAGLNTLAAAAGAAGLAWGLLPLDDAATSRLPWGSTVVGGIALALLVAAPNAVLTVLALRRQRWVGPVAVAVGLLLVLWILVELAFIRELSFFHPLYVVVGLVLAWLGTRIVMARAGLTRRELGHQVHDVLTDLPLFLAAPLVRRRHLRWGATDDEVSDGMPGDSLLPHAAYRATRAITIDAPPERVWPWLVQVGCLRGGFYADDLLDNLARPSAETIEPALQHLSLGQLVPMSGSPRPDTAFVVADYDALHWLLWTKQDSTWAWRLSRTDAGGTRLVTRVQAVHPWQRPASGLLSWVLLEFGDFPMMRRMLRGIKRRSESSGLPDPQPQSERGRT